LTEVESEDGTAYDICHTDQATGATTKAKQTPRQHGGVYYSFLNELSFLQRLLGVTNGE
jgi:hypothetical protein